ncbi:hypothetical protein MAJ_09069, partial [Metarhizium majus ARSEF 297]
MKLSSTLVTALLGLAAAAPQNDPSTEGLSKELADEMQKVLKQLEEDNKKSIPGTIKNMAEQLGWQAAGNLPGKVGQGATLLSFLATSDYSVTPENGKEWVKNLGGVALSFLPKTIAIGLERAQFPELAAKRDAEAKCFADNKVRTYKDLCAYCKPHLTISLLGRLNECTDDLVADRDYYVDHKRAQSFCTDAVLCSGYNDGGPSKIIKNGFRYDPLRSFWCKDKDVQIGMLLSSWIGEPLRDSLWMLDAEEFRNALTPACKEITKDLNIEGTCPKKEELEAADKLAPPQSYCQPGQSVAAGGADRPFVPKA